MKKCLKHPIRRQKTLQPQKAITEVTILVAGLKPPHPNKEREKKTIRPFL
jgi:hypothetical protein